MFAIPPLGMPLVHFLSRNPICVCIVPFVSCVSCQGRGSATNLSLRWVCKQASHQSVHPPQLQAVLWEQAVHQPCRPWSGENHCGSAAALVTVVFICSHSVMKLSEEVDDEKVTSLASCSCADSKCRRQTYYSILFYNTVLLTRQQGHRKPWLTGVQTIEVTAPDHSMRKLGGTGEGVSHQHS